MPSVNLKFSASLRGSHPHKLIRFLASSATTAAIPSPRTNLWLLARPSSSARRSPAAALSRAWVAAPLDGRYGNLRERTSSGAGSHFVRSASWGCKCVSSSGSSGIEGGKNEGLLRDDDGKSSSQLESGNQRPPPPSVQNQEEKTDQLLTLPTILTLGRVAAVPLLVSSKFHFHLKSEFWFCSVHLLRFPRRPCRMVICSVLLCGEEKSFEWFCVIISNKFNFFVPFYVGFSHMNPVRSIVCSPRVE